LTLVYTATDTDLKKSAGQTRYQSNGGRIFGVMDQRHSIILPIWTVYHHDIGFLGSTRPEA
jgi:hypothetical protein